MIDFLLGLYFAGLFVRGWVRGFTREAMDLVGLIIGIALAFRFSGLLGDALAEWLGVSPELGRLAGGLALFLVVGVLASIGAHYLQRVFTLPGLALTHRLLGGGLALAWALFMAILLLSLLVVLPLPDGVGERIDESKVASALTDPESLPQRMFFTVAGDRVLEALLNLDRLVGRDTVILEEAETLAITPAEPEDLRRGEKAAMEIFELVNRSRIEEGLDPLAWSAPLAVIGDAHATDMYVEGYFGHTSPTTGTVADRMANAGIPYSIVGENLALAATARTVHDGLMGSPGHRANILESGFTRVGIGVIRGPLGLMVVQVFSG
ncbi:MAG: CvpA family protein [Thermoanaerobaculales bacterium]|nr:CvpA family protein [Thermoanaerobaculales bacterium]